MKLIPPSHLGMSGSIQKYMLLYIVVIAIALTILFDLSRIASIGAIFYLVMDRVILIMALLLDLIVLIAFLWVKASSDIFVVIVSASGVVLVFAGEKWFLHWKENK